MGVKFWNFNLVDQDQTVITPSSTNALFPADNIKDSRSTKVFRSTAASCNIVFDFITTESVDSILLAPNFINSWGFITPITVEANPTDTWGAPAFSTTITAAEVDQVHGIAIKEFSAQSYRFWRLTFTGGSYVELSKVFIGSVQSVGTRSVSFGWAYADTDLSQSIANRYGQKFTDIITGLKRMSFSLNLLGKDEMDDVFSVFDYNRTHIPFFFELTDCDILNNTNRIAGRFFFDELPQITNSSYGLFDLSLTISEAK